MAGRMNDRRDSYTILDSQRTLLHECPHVRPVAQKYAAPVLKQVSGIFLDIGRNGGWRNSPDGSLQEFKRMESLRLVEKDVAGLRVDPVASKAPKDLEIDGDQTLILLALPEKAPAIGG